MWATEECVQIPCSETFKALTLETEREGDCQDITLHQSPACCLNGLYSLSECHSVANAGWSQSELLILGKLWQGLLHRWIAVFTGETEARRTEPCFLSSVPHQQSPVKNMAPHQIWGDSYLMRCPLFSTNCQVTKWCRLITVLMIYDVQE